jgi:DNA primase catalytic subunit
MNKEVIKEKYQKLIEAELTKLNNTKKELSELELKIKNEYYIEERRMSSIKLFNQSGGIYFSKKIPFDKLNPISKRYVIDTDREQLLKRRIKRINAKIRKLKRDEKCELSSEHCYDAMGNIVDIGDIILWSDGDGFQIMKACEHKETVRLNLETYAGFPDANLRRLKVSILRSPNKYLHILKISDDSLKALNKHIKSFELNKIVDSF